MGEEGTDNERKGKKGQGEREAVKGKGGRERAERKRRPKSELNNMPKLTQKKERRGRGEEGKGESRKEGEKGKREANQ